MKPSWLSRDLARAPFHYTLATNEKLFRKALKHSGIPKKDWPECFMQNWHSYATAHLLENRKQENVVAIVSMRGWEKVDLACIVGILAHEATHLWQWTKEYLGEKAPSAEFEAYSIQGFTQSLFEEFQRQTKEKHHE